jgi:hypothetical protein
MITDKNKSSMNKKQELLNLNSIRLSLPTHKESVEACDNSKFDKTSKDKDSWNSGKVAGWNECYFWISNLINNRMEKEINYLSEKIDKL